MDGKFWMCFVEGSSGCRYIHHSLENAKEEAQRLLKLSGNETKRVYIMESTQYCQVEHPPIVWHEINKEGYFETG